MISLQQILAELSPKVGQTAFIAIDGKAGSGKSTLAALLAEKLEAEIIKTDDFAGWQEPFAWAPKVIEQVFVPIQNGATSLSYKRASWWAGHHPEPIINQPVTPVMILEGVSAARHELTEYVSLRIFVDTPKDICLARGIERDTDNGTLEEITALWSDWSVKEDAFFTEDKTRERADIVLDGTSPFAEQLN